MSGLGTLALLFFLLGKKSSPKEGDTFLIRDAKDKSIRLRFQRAGAGFAWVPIEAATFEGDETFRLPDGSTWDFFRGLNAFVLRAPGAPPPKVQGALAPEQGNRWHAIRYRWRGSTSGTWGTPFWSDLGSARELTPLGSELWAWVAGNWKKLW